MELIKDIPFCSNADKQFKLDLCLPASVDHKAVRKHVRFKTTKGAGEEQNKQKVNNITCNNSGIRNEFALKRENSYTKRRLHGSSDSGVDPYKRVEVNNTECERKNCQEVFRDSVKTAKAPFVIFVHGGGWRRGGKQAWKHYLYHDVNFLVAILQWLLNVHRNVGISLAQNGVGCALISYPLTEQDMPYVFIEMLISYIQSSFVTFLGLLPISIILNYILQIQRTNGIDWIPVLSGDRYDIRMPYFIVVLLITNIITLIIFTVKREKFRLSYFHLGFIWSVFLSSYLWISLLTSYYQLTFLTFVTLTATQAVILRRRLSRREITYADQAKVVARAVHWAKRLARKSGQFDRERIYLMGHSAGGHLVTLTVFDDFYLKDACCTVQDIKGVISLAGVYDLDCLNAKFLKQTYLVPNFGEHEPTWRKASPFHQVKKSKTVRRPKFLLMSAELDPVLIQQSHAFSEKLTKSGLDCEHVTVHGSNHFTIITNLVRIFGGNDQSVLKLTLDFISKS